MTATADIDPTWDIPAICAAAGNADDEARRIRRDKARGVDVLTLQGVTQEALDAAILARVPARPPTDWDGFAVAASATSLYLKLLLYAPANLFTAIMAQLQTYHSEERLLLHFAQCSASMPEGQEFTPEEIAEVNGLLEQHNFAGRIPQ